MIKNIPFNELMKRLDALLQADVDRRMIEDKVIENCLHKESHHELSAREIVNICDSCESILPIKVN